MWYEPKYTYICSVCELLQNVFLCLRDRILNISFSAALTYEYPHNCLHDCLWNTFKIKSMGIAYPIEIFIMWRIDSISLSLSYIFCIPFQKRIKISSRNRIDKSYDYVFFFDASSLINLTRVKCKLSERRCQSISSIFTSVCGAQSPSSCHFSLVSISSWLFSYHIIAVLPYFWEENLQASANKPGNTYYCIVIIIYTIYFCI